MQLVTSQNTTHTVSLCSKIHFPLQMNADHIPIVNMRRPTLISKDLPFERCGNFMY